MDCPENLKYTKDHEWVLFENGVATLGITHFAQDELGEIVFVDLPGSGLSVTKGESVCVVESTKAASDVYSPIAGTVKEANPDLENEPTLVNSDPYGKGWMVRFEAVNETDLGDLMSADEYSAHVGS
jgi:glycine cleavage system H protein